MDRIIIEGVAVPNSFIIRGSYNAQTEPRECEKYTDATGVDHIIPYAKKRQIIGFTLRDHDSAEHAQFAALISKRINVSVEYWDDDTASYKTGFFELKANAWSHANIIGQNIEYNENQITLREL